MCGGDEEVADDVGFLGPHAAHADAAAPLAAVGIERDALDVVVQGEGDDDVLLGDEVFDVHLTRIKGDFCAAFVAVFVTHFDELVFDDGKHLRAVGEDALELLDQLQHLLVLLLDLFALEAGEALETQVKDGLRLFLGELEAVHECRACDVCRAALAYRCNDSVQMVECYCQSFEDMGTCLCLCQFIAGAPRDDHFLMVDVVLKDMLEVHDDRLAVDEGEHDDAEAVLQLCVFVELVEDDVRCAVAAQFDDDAHAAAVGFVTQVSDAVDLLVADELGDLLDEACLVDLIRQLGDDDARFSIAHRFDVGTCAHLDDAASCGICLADFLGAEDEPRRREVGSLDDAHELVDGGIGVVDEHEGTVDDLDHVVRRDVGRHADSDARRAVDEELREFCREDGRLFLRAVVVVRKVNGFLVDVAQHEFGDLRHAHLGVAHGGGGVTVDGAEVAVAVREHVTHGEVLCHADDGIVDGAVAVRVVFTENFTDDARRFLVRLAARHARALHRVEDAAVHGLQAVAYVRKRARDDDAHCIVDVRVLHLVFEVDGDDAPLSKVQIQNVTSPCSFHKNTY